jgi:SNF2 family DNA or RNA helicase
MLCYARETEKHETKGNKVLILTPLTTITNWVNELYMWRTSDMETVLGEVFNFYGNYITSVNI